MSDNPTPSREAANRILDQVKRGFLNYVDHWQEWIVPMITVAAIVILSILCCWFPYLLVLGPVICGLNACALAGLRGRPIHTQLLSRGWQRFGGSVAASILITVVSMLPLFLLMGLFFAFFATIAATSPGPAVQHRRQQVQPADQRPANELDSPRQPENGPVENAGDIPARPQSPQQPSALDIVPLFLMMIFCYALMFLVILLAWVWQLWFSTRTMFVFPLLADRNLGWVESLRLSWSESRVRFWELLCINLAAQFIAMAGMYLMYVGMLFTVPIGMTMIALVYEQRFNTPGSES